MAMFGKQAQWLFPPMAALLLILVPAAPGAEQPSKTATPDAMKKRTAREKAFLLRAVEDMDNSQEFVKEIAAVLKKQSDAAADALDSERRRNDLRDLLDWYQQYSGWLSGMAAEVETDLAEHFSRRRADAGWTGRYEYLTKGYQRLSEQLSGKVRKLEEEQSKIEARMRKLEQAVQDRRILVDKEELELSKELWPTYRYNPYDHREAVYRNLTDDEIARFQSELKALGEQQKHFEVVTKLGQYELGWLSIKAGDSEALYAVARAIGDDAPGPLENAYRGAIRTYEADIATLKRKVDEIKGKLVGITRTGTLKTLDRLKDLTDYYEKMKSRYERHIEWLRGQIGSYQADLVELEREM